jgi:cytochrome c peroxidase
MLRFQRPSAWVAVLCISFAFTGCRQPAPEPDKPDTTKTNKKEENKPGADGKPKISDEPNGKTDTQLQPKPTTDVPIDASEPVGPVLLGNPSLTAGIPGEGDLTIEQIQAWLENEANHKSLDFELPLGLSLGKDQIKGIDANPLTRAKIELGRQLFFDTRLSSDDTVSCASCHRPDHGYAADTRFGVGIGGQEGPVNTPVAYNRILSELQFWDGRAATLEDQAKGPIQNPIEMGNTHEQVVKTIGEVDGYRMQFEKVFSDGVTIDNVAKAIASFERAIVTGPSPFDHYQEFQRFADLDEDDLAEINEDEPELYAKIESAKAGAESHPMSDSAKRGRELFFSQKSKCSACHVGANLSDEKYHNIGIGMEADEPALGRFNESNDEKDKGAFKTPTIRNVALTPPYMHDGSLKTLRDVVEHYAKGGTPNAWLHKDIHKLELTDENKQDLVEFMKACTGDLPIVETARLP